MATWDLYIDTNSGTVVTSLTNSTPVDSLPTFVQGDTPTLRVFLLIRSATYPLNPYTIMSTAGITLQLAIGDKRGDLTNLYTQQFTWTTDSGNTYFAASLPLNTAAITALLGVNTPTAITTLEIKYLSGSLPTTVLEIPITINAAVNKPGAITVPAGQTAISAEEVKASYLQRTIHGPIYLVNDNIGKKVALYLGDDGTVHMDPVT